MQERLIEHWLDSVNERGYQSAFLQMLIGEGYGVIHSTRHGPIEFGKDVIATAEDGTHCAFQLKGDPGSRLTLSKFRSMQEQITELVEVPIKYPGLAGNEPHRSFLVTNGEIEEEVQVQVGLLNEGYARRGLGSLSLIGRGLLLKWSIAHATDFWPQGFSIQEKLIRLYNEDGNAPPRFDLISAGLDEILRLSGSPDQLPATEFDRRAISAGLFAGFTLRNYTQARNHVAIAGVQAALFAHIASAESRHERYGSKRVALVLAAARNSFLDAIRGLADELADRMADRIDGQSGEGADPNKLFLEEGGMLANHFLWRARALRTMSLLAIGEIARKRDGTEWSQSHGRIVDTLVRRRPTHTLDVWGEAAIPQVLAWVWSRPVGSAPGVEVQLVRLICRSNLSREDGYIPDPYHLAEEVIRNRIGSTMPIGRGKVTEATQGRSSYMALGLFQCIVRRNLKQTAKSLWPDLTKLEHKSMMPDGPWAFALWRTDNGVNEDRQIGPRGEWSVIQNEAAETATPCVPPSLQKDPVMLLAFITFFPHRTLSEVLRHLHHEICGMSFLPPPDPPQAT